jgi:glutaredoxin
MSLEAYMKRVPGRKTGDVLLFALSTCGWCRKTKNLLNDMGVEYAYIDVDLLDGEAKREAMEVVGRWNQRRSFPTIVINNSRGIIGFQEDEMKELLGS